MKTIMTFIALAGLAAAQPQPRYTISDLRPLPGGTFSQAAAVSENGLITGVSTTADGSQHAVIWRNGQITDIGKTGLGGPNNGAFGLNARGDALLQAESAEADPDHENFCLYGTGLKCLAAVWQN